MHNYYAIYTFACNLVCLLYVKIYIIYTHFWKYYFKIVHIFILIIYIAVRYIDVSICDSIVRQ